jgi:hypothetical protein
MQAADQADHYTETDAKNLQNDEHLLNTIQLYQDEVTKDTDPNESPMLSAVRTAVFRYLHSIDFDREEIDWRQHPDTNAKVIGELLVRLDAAEYMMKNLLSI